MLRGGVIDNTPIYNICSLPDELKGAGILLGVSFQQYQEIFSILEKENINDYMRIVIESSPFLEITTKIGCSINCRYCPQKELIEKYFFTSTEREHLMTYEDFKKYLEKIPQSVNIVFSGMCEPFLNADCAQMINYAFHKGHKVALATTLVGLQKRDLELIAETEFAGITIHLPDVMGNAKIDVTDEYLENLNLFLKLDNRSIKQAEFFCHGEIEQRCKKIVGDRFCRFKLHDRAGNLQNEDLPHIHLSGSVICGRRRDLNTNVLLPDGSIVLCCMDYSLDYVLGNLREQTYEEILHGKRMQDVINAMERGEECICQYCANAVEKKRWERVLGEYEDIFSRK